MAKFYESINDKMREFIEAQHIFFVASAPLDASGHVNVSPKGYDCFRILSENRVAYLDLTGSGSETSAHLMENGRITIMFCAFAGPPNIVRLFGTGRAVLPHDADWADLRPLFADIPGTRQIIVADIYQTQTSCGYSVPFMEYTGERDTLTRWADVKGADGLHAYWCEKNMQSIDGLPTPLGVELTPSEGNPS